MIKLPDTDGLQEKVRLGEQTGPGPRLRAAREAADLEIEDIAKQLRLHPHIIDDLEHDTFADHLALVFIRGYLRAYATLIGLDPDQVVDEFNALGYQEDRDLPDLKGKPNSINRMRNSQGMGKSMSPGLKWAMIAGLVATLGGIFVAYNHEPEEAIYTPSTLVSDSTEPSPTDSLEPTPDDQVSVMPDANAVPVPAPGAAEPNSGAPVVRQATQAPASAPAAAPAPAPAPSVAAPAPKPVPSHRDEDDGPDAENEPDLPRPGFAS